MRQNHLKQLKQGGTIFVCALLSLLTYGQLPAFPGAEGYGKNATGGRGGRVIEVTTLEDIDRYGNLASGSFREALITAGNDPITIVFRVSGIIELSAELKSNRSNMTIAGQTAPGDGICIKDASVKLSGDNLIIRYLRFRPGDETQQQVSGLNIENAKNIIVDHCSFSWSIEENATFYDNKYTTVQWCIISEALYDSYHSKGPRGYAGQWGGQYASYHHNLIASNKSRSPRINGCRAHDTIALNDFRNNVIFNWGSTGAIYGGEVEIYWDDPEAPGTNKAGSFNNFVNNYYKPGPGTSSTHRFAVPSLVSEGNTAKGHAEWYFSGNYMEGVDGGMNDDNWLGVDASKVGGIDSIKVDVEHEVEEVTTHTALEAYNIVLDSAGARKPKPDTVDSRIIAEIKGESTISGDGIIDSQTEVGGWPEYRMPAEENIPADTDKDGMPDYWETENDLDPNNADDGKEITADGYSNLEHYLNSDIPYIQPGPTNIRSNKTIQVNLYPNPVENKLYFVNDQGISKIEIYLVDGKKIFENEIKPQQNSVDLKDLNDGLYMVSFFMPNGNSVTQKIVKN